MDEALRLATSSLHVEFGHVLERLEDGRSLRVAAAVGWKGDVLGRTVAIEDDQTLIEQGPLIVHDFRREKKLAQQTWLSEHEIVSGLSVVLPGREHVQGFLGVFTRHPGKFYGEDVRFLQTLAVVLAQAVQRRRAEEALAHEKNLLHVLLETSPDSIYFKDVHSRFLRISRSQASRFGLADPRQAIGKTDFDFFGHEHAEQAFADEQAVMKLVEPIVNKEECLRSRDGSARWVSTTKMPLRDSAGHVTGTMGISRDITSLKHAQNHMQAQYALARMLTRGATLHEAAPGILRTMGGVIGWDVGVLWALDRHAASFRCVDLWQATSVDVVSLAAAIRGSALEPALVKSMFSGTEDSLNCMSLTADATTPRHTVAYQSGLRTVLVFPVSVGGETLGLVEFFSRDVHVLDDALQGTLLSMAGQLGQFFQQKALEEQFLQAQKMEAIGKLAGGVAHDFNNLLTVINGYSEVVLGLVSSAEPVSEMVREIVKAGERAAALTRQLLAFGRKQILQPRPVNLNDLVRGMYPMLQRMIGEAYQLLPTLDADLNLVNADAPQLEQVLMNLVVNARDAMPRGGAIFIETGNVDLAYSGQATPVVPSGSYVFLRLRDSGVGFDDAVKSRLFEPFFTTKELGKGSGLGLATVYGIVKQSAGFIDVQSEPGRGATFTILLPRLDAAKSLQAEKVRQSTPLPRGTETILLVEDEDAVRSLARSNLQSAGYTVLEASHAHGAMELVRQHHGPVHLLVTDVVMPGLSGRQLADALCAERPKLKVLFLTGYTEDAAIREGATTSGAPVLLKPFSMEVLARKVREILDA